jgi:hypothetical protein
MYIHDFDLAPLVLKSVESLNEYYLRTARGSAKVNSLDFMLHKTESPGIRSYHKDWVNKHFPRITVPEHLWIGSNQQCSISHGTHSKSSSKGQTSRSHKINCSP